MVTDWSKHGRKTKINCKNKSKLENGNYFRSIFSDTQVSDCDSLFRLKLLARHVNIVGIFVFIITVPRLK